MLLSASCFIPSTCNINDVVTRSSVSLILKATYTSAQHDPNLTQPPTCPSGYRRGSCRHHGIGGDVRVEKSQGEFTTCSRWLHHHCRAIL